MVKWELLSIKPLASPQFALFNLLSCLHQHFGLALKTDMFVAKILILFLCGVGGLPRICSGSIYGDLQIYGSLEIAPVLV